jgi:hypothetical protein
MMIFKIGRVLLEREQRLVLIAADPLKLLGNKARVIFEEMS